MVSVKPNDHWAFLEEIEASMFVDLTLEANFYGHSNTDELFESSHIFHGCSARELKSAFSHPSEKLKSIGASSSKLPSRSNNQYPVGVLGSQIRNSFLARRLKPESSYINPTRISRSKSSPSGSSVAMHILPSRLKTSSVCENSKARFTSSTQKRESRTYNTVTVESKMQLQQHVLEESSKVVGQSNDLISIMRRRLRNSRVASQASWVEEANSQRSGSSNSLMQKKLEVGKSKGKINDKSDGKPKTGGIYLKKKAWK